MKFTKEEALKDLMGKIPNKGQTLNISERTINEQLDALMPLLTDDDTELSDFVGKVLPIFKVTDGNVRNDVSAAIKSYQASNPIASNHQSEPKTDVEPQLPKELEERLRALEEENLRIKKEKAITEKKGLLLSKMKEKGVKNTEWAESMLSMMSINEELDIDAKADECVKVYNKFIAGGGEESKTPNAPNGGSVDKNKNDIIAAAARIAKQNSLVG